MDSFTIILPFPVSVNALYVNKGRGKRYKSKRYVAWLKKCPNLSDYRHNGKCYITYTLFPPDNRIRDGQNFMKAPLDYIVNQGVISDDNMNIVIGEQWLKGCIDKVNPRIELKIIKDNK